MNDLQPHPAATVFPEMSEKEFADLKEDIRLHGQRDPLTVFQGQILDGRNRYRACRELGIEAKTEEFIGDDPVAFVVSKNLKRRHLDESQRALVAARLANLPKGRPAENSSIDPLSISQPAAAKKLNVSVPSVKRAAVVLNSGIPELTSSVEQGDVSVAAAVEIASLPAAEQKKIVDEGAVAVKRAASIIRGKRSTPNATEGEHEVNESDARDLLREVRGFKERLDAMPELGAMVSRFDYVTRVWFCDDLERLARGLADLAYKIRHGDT